MSPAAQLEEYGFEFTRARGTIFCANCRRSLGTIGAKGHAPGCRFTLEALKRRQPLPLRERWQELRAAAEAEAPGPVQDCLWRAAAELERALTHVRYAEHVARTHEGGAFRAGGGR